MALPLLIIVTGLPCAGKTLLSRQLADRFNLPYLSKDNIKERLFDSLGWKDRAWSKALSRASIAILFDLMEEILSVNLSIVVDCNFDPKPGEADFRALAERVAFTPLQIQCVADGPILYQRFLERSGKRHPGHVDEQALDGLAPLLLLGRLERMQIGGYYVEVDTSNFMYPIINSDFEDNPPAFTQPIATLEDLFQAIALLLQS